MTVLSDAVVIGTVLSIVFAAVAYYLYSRVVQVESKLGLMENILLDLKVTTEQALLASPTADTHVSDEHANSEFSREVREVQYESSPRASTAVSDLVVERESAPPSSPVVSSEQDHLVSSGSEIGPNFEAMTYKELVVEARKRKVVGYSHMSKSALCDALRKQVARGVDAPSEETVSLTQWTLEQVPQGLEVQKEPESALSALEDNGVATLEGEALVA